jgi:DNA-binding winged helix-turn-helix (wHTH) protein
VRVRFGDFIVDDQARQVLREGAEVHLSPKAFDLLALLIRERPKALSKEDLHARLWPQTFVSDASLAMLVAEVRAALGETAKSASAIRTLHRHGYAFQADAEELASAAGGRPPGAAAAGDSQGYWLVTADRQIALERDENIVGRDPKVRVWLDAPSVSRRHARIRVESGRAFLEDLDSKNGTFVGETRVSRAPRALQDGDELRFGSVAATFRAWAEEPTRTEGDAM